MIRSEALQIIDAYLFPLIAELYGLEDYKINPVAGHDGGRNIVYSCEKESTNTKIIRISFLPDRSQEDFLSELEYIRYLYTHGGSVSNVLDSRNGRLLEQIVHNGQGFFVCVFDKAIGKLLVENNYKYREGVPLTEYFYNCGKTLGKLHALSKGYNPVRQRYSFFDKYNTKYLNQLIPDSLILLKEKLFELLAVLEGMDKNRETFGMVHFDYSDGNYMIDFESGKITVFDFDNACFFWYLYDLANIWTHGVGWVQFEKDVGKREKFMRGYFETVLAGYRSETDICDSMLELLPLFIKVTVMENIVDAFEVMQNNGEKQECDEGLSYLIKCMEDDIPYKGFFHDIYSCNAPFEYEEREI